MPHAKMLHRVLLIKAMTDKKKSKKRKAVDAMDDGKTTTMCLGLTAGCNV